MLKERDYANILKYLKDHLFDRNKYNEIISICEFWNRAVNDNTAIIYFFLGIAYNGVKDFYSSIQSHKKALQLDPTLADIKYKQDLYKGIYDEYRTACIGCGSNEYDIVNVTNQSITEVNLGIINPLRIWVQCKDCGLIFANPIPSKKSMDTYYSLITKERREGGRYTNVDNMLEFLIKMSNYRLEKIEHIRNGRGSLLDIGTGVGVFVGVALERGWRAEGLELTQEDCKYAKENFGISLRNRDFYALGEGEDYDVITLFEVIEHLRTPLKDLKQINRLVKDNGLLVIATPIVDSLHGKKARETSGYWNVVTHLSYFSKSVLMNYLEKAGFETIEVNYSPEGIGRMEFYCKKVKNVEY
ncbi:class I SAM-dependent methyltransferase [Pseudoclostridium thermosuccinogenes]|uniref:class I SAM-dependent methyltransferase n=1 Tax=Clostridium thermosuccinogenes TaxID=84032 RepID=UPI002FD90892